jgi:hypothetical protein
VLRQRVLEVLQKFKSLAEEYSTSFLGSLKCKLLIDQEKRPLILFLTGNKAMVGRVSAEGFEIFHQKMSTIRKMLNIMACTEARVTTIHRRLSINREFSRKCIHRDVD